MSSQQPPEVAELGVRLCDEAYMVWYTAAAQAGQALQVWFVAARGERVSQYFAYRAALDREEAAARDLERLSELTQPCRHALTRRRQPAATLVADPQPVSA